MKTFALMFAALLATAPCAVAEAPGLPAPMSDVELEEARGGFLVFEGMAFDFGAVARSYVDGQLVLESRLTWTPDGLRIEQIGQTTDPLPDSLMQAMTAAGLDLSDLDDGGVFITPDGASAFIHRAYDGELSNLLLNTGYGRELRQETELNLNLLGFEAVQQDMTQALAARALADDIAAATFLSGRF